MSVVTINVMSYNRKPIAHAGPNQMAFSGVLVTLDGSGSSDPEGETLSYSWELVTRPLTSHARLANRGSVNPSFITDRDGMYIARLVVNDGKLDSSPSRVTITVTGEANTAPVLATITSPQTIEMGTELRFTLSATDVDTNDSVSFFANNLPANSRLDGASGKFRFQPAPDQVGSHTVTFVATDGKESHSQDVVLTVQAATANQPTALKSKVIDANAYSETGAIVPIAGVRITVEGSTITATTDSNGVFTISGIPHGAKIVNLNASGLRAPNSHHYADFSGRLKIMQNVLNRPIRDYMLPRVNPSHMTMVDPTQDTMVSNNDIGVSMMVPAGTAMNTDGTMYSGPLSISMVPIDATPRELPENFNPSFLITLQPVSVRFSNPVPVTFPNMDDLAPDTLMDLFSLSEKGGFKKVGVGRVSADGRTITLLEGGIEATTWHFVSVSTPTFSGFGGNSGGGGFGQSASSASGGTGPIDPGDGSGPGDPGDGSGPGDPPGGPGDPGDGTGPGTPPGGPGDGTDPSDPSEGGADDPLASGDPDMNPQTNTEEGATCEGSLICASTGMLREEHSLPEFIVSGLRISPAVVYANTNSLESLTLKPKYRYNTRRFTMGVDDSRIIEIAERPPASMGMSFELQGRVSSEVFFDTSPVVGANALAPFISSQKINIKGLKTGIYVLTARLNLISGPIENRSRRMQKNRFYYPVVSPETPFGMGWKLKELQSLHGVKSLSDIDRNLSASDNRVMLVLDDFRHLIFKRNSDRSYSPPKGDYSKLYALPDPLGGFVRELKSGDSYVFDRDGLLLGWVDRYGRRTSYFYLADGRLSYILYDNGSRTTLGYGEDGLIDSLTDPAGRVTGFIHDDRKNLVRITDPDDTFRRFEYKYNHSMTAQIDKLNRVKGYVYDERGNVTHSIRSDQTQFQLQSSSTELISEGQGTEASPFNLAIADDDSSFTQISNGRGHLARFQTNDFGAITKRIDAMGGESVFERDENNNVIRSLDENGNLTENEYNMDGSLLSRTTPVGTMTYEYMEQSYVNFHQPISKTDERGLVTHFEYDRFGNVTKMTDPQRHLTTFTYKNNYLLESEQNHATDSRTLYEYDSNGNLTSVRDTYQRTLLTATYDMAGNVLSHLDAMGNRITFTYDPLNRPLSKRDALNGEVSFSYDAEGNLLSLNDQRNHSTSFLYDNMDRLIQNMDPLGNFLTYSYDENGNLVQRTDKNGHTTLYEYDALDRLISKSYSDGTMELYTYDSNGNILSATDSDSSLTYTYDSLNRMSTVSTGEGNFQPEVNITYTYDKNNNIVGLADSVTGGFYRIQYEYNSNNNLIRMGYRLEAGHNAIRFSYDSLRRLKEIIYPNQIRGQFSYVPGKIWQLRSVQYGTPSHPTSVSSFVYNYNLNNHVVGLGTSRGSVPVNTSMSYSYDVLNRLTSATPPIGQDLESFTYDILGNRLRRDGETVSSSFNAHNQLLNDKSYSYTYDKNGNLLVKTDLSNNKVTEYAWDYENRLTGVVERALAEGPAIRTLAGDDGSPATRTLAGDGSPATRTISYRYDPLGRRIGKEVDGVATKYVYDRDHILLEFDSNNELQARYLHSSNVDEPIRMEREVSPYRNESFLEQYFYYHRDRLGNVTEVTNFVGDVVQRYVYDSFGRMTIYDDQGNVITEESEKYLPNPFTYTGREYDPETGLYYLRSRYYDPEMGRFLSEDPREFQGGAGIFMNMWAIIP